MWGILQRWKRAAGLLARTQNSIESWHTLEKNDFNFKNNDTRFNNYFRRTTVESLIIKNEKPSLNPQQKSHHINLVNFVFVVSIFISCNVLKTPTLIMIVSLLGRKFRQKYSKWSFFIHKRYEQIKQLYWKCFTELFWTLFCQQIRQSFPMHVCCMPLRFPLFFLMAVIVLNSLYHVLREPPCSTHSLFICKFLAHHVLHKNLAHPLLYSTAIR